MKQSIHPEYMSTAVKCNGCGNSFESRSTVPAITVEICSNCHPFYTGKQKLIDTAGRVDKFNARREAAKAHVKATPKSAAPAEDAVVEKIEEELEANTVDLPETSAEETTEQ